MMPIRYKIEILPALKAIGYTQTRIREDKLMGQATLQQLRHGELASWKTIDTVCRLLDCQPGDLLEHVPTEDTAGE
ncbi:helix-turn-helix domain-containing protein [Faecalibacterium duncaniae]|jgi:putative transcriptional regulator|nr:MAG TPA: Cro/C1-type HTH DNA-binding domain protein [Caudoviricetes sp.]